MADRKITDLTALAAGSQATGDLLTIVDVSEAAATDKNKKITVESLFKGIPGDVGIGTTSPNDRLHVRESDASAAAASGASVTQFERAGNVGITLSTADTGDATIFFGDTSSATVGRVNYDHNDNSLQFWANSLERARIDSSGNVGIGTSSPTNQLHIYDGTAANDLAELKIESFRPGIRLLDRSTSSSSAEIVGDNALLFKISVPVDDDTALTERMRIDNSGRLLVGLSSAGSGSKIEAKTGTVSSGSSYLGVKAFTANIPYSTTNKTSSMLSGFDGNAIHGVDVGYSYDGTGYYLALATNSNLSSTPTERMRIQSNGQVEFKNGSFGDNIDCVMANNGTMEIGAQTEIKFRTATNERMRVTNNGLTFNGDTAAANALDDYEEGTWTPIDNSAGLTFSLADGRYVKIGSLVHCWGRITYPTTSSTSATDVGGFPFTNLHVTPPNYSGNIAITDYGNANILPMVENNKLKFRNYSNGSLTNANLSGKFVYFEFRLRT